MRPVPLSEPFNPQTVPAAAGFDDPAGLLHACHERVHERCRLLERLLQHVATHGADTQAQEAATNILRYFDTAAPQHHEDEERHVFPRLLASNDATLVQCVKTLQRQHHEMADAWQKLRALLMAVQQGDAGGLLGQAAFVDSFVALYQAHIALEEGTAFPAGFADMPPDQRTQMGKEMAARRGATRLSSKG
ncbi:MAG: hemerythrin domain-containing protein [Brachymonas sp.]